MIEYLENDVGVGILGKESWRRHLPFLGTLFMFIVVNNIIGIIPGMKPGTVPSPPPPPWRSWCSSTSSAWA